MTADFFRGDHSDDSDGEVGDGDFVFPDTTSDVQQPILLDDADNEQMDTREQSDRTETTSENVNFSMPNIQQPEHTGEDTEDGTPLPEHRFVSFPFLVILRLWAVICKIPATQMDLLMKLLRKNNSYCEFAQLPKNWKTVVKLKPNQKTKYKVHNWGTNEAKARFAYVGIETRLNQCRAMYIPDGSRGK
jgi:hypothetical protein